MLRTLSKGLSNIIPARDGKKSLQNGDMEKPTTSIDGFVKNLESSPQRSRERHSREPHRQTYDPQRHAYDPHRRNQDRNSQPMYDSRRPVRDASPQGRRSRQDGYNGSYERHGRYGDNYGYSRDYVPGKPPPGSPRRSRSNQSPTRSYSPSRAYNHSRSYSPTRNHSSSRNHSPTRARSPSPDRIHNHPYVSEGSREVTINSEAKREEVEFHFDESGQRVTTGHTVIAVTAYRAGQPDGPPKPPRRQQSLNRIHIPEGPDYDPTSASDSPHSGNNSPRTSKRSDVQTSHREPTYANYTSSGYSQQSQITYTQRSQSVNMITAKVPELTRQRSVPESRSGYYDDPPTYGDVEEYRARAAMGEYTDSRQKPAHVKTRKNKDTSNRMYRSDGELNAVQSEPELDWSRKPTQLHHSDSLRTDPGRYNTTERPHRPTHLKHTDSLRSAPGGYSYGNSWQDEPSWKRDPRQRYLQEQPAYHSSLDRPSRRDHVPRSQRPVSLPFPDKYGSNEVNYNSKQYQPDRYDERSRSPDYAQKLSNPMDYNQQGHDSNSWRHGKRSTSSSKQGYNSDSGISSFRHPSEGEQVDPVYENTDRRQDDPLYQNTNGYPKERNGIWERDGGEYVIKGPHEMPVDVPGEIIQQQTSAPLMANPPGTLEGSRAGLHTVPRDEIQDAPSSSTQDPKWAEHLARREQRREVLRSSSQDSLVSNESDQNQSEKRRHPQRRHTTEVPLSLVLESAFKPQQANTQESGYTNDMPKRQRQDGRTPSQGEYVPNSMYHVPYSDPNAPYAPKRPYDPYNPYHYGPYADVPPRMDYSPVHSMPPYKGYPEYGHPMPPMDPRYRAQSPTRMPYGPGHPSSNQHAPGNQSPTIPREADGWTNRPYSEGAPQRWPGPDPRYGPPGFVQEPYMPYNQARETYSAAYTMPPYMQQGGYYQPPIPSAMFYGSHYPGEAAPGHQSVPPQISSAQRSRSVDAAELRASVQQEVQASPPASPSASLSPHRSLSPDEKNKKLEDLRQRVKSYMPGEERKRSHSVGSSKPAREEVIAPTKADVAHAQNVPSESNIPPSQSHASSESKPAEQKETAIPTATSVGAKLFLKKKKEAVIEDLKKKMIRERQYGSEPELTTDREVPSKSSSARPLRVTGGSSGNDATDSRESRRKADKAAEVALNELEQMYALLDREAEDLLMTGEYEQQYDRLNELKIRTRQRLEEIKLERELEEEGLTPPSQRGKRRPRRERAKSDITPSYRSQSLTNLTQSDDERQQQFFPYRTAQHPDNLNLDDQSYKPPADPRMMQFIKRNTDSSSDEDDAEVRRPQSNIYRAPRSEDYLGYSSDSSPSPERRMRNSKRKPVAQPRKSVQDGKDPVLPEYVKKSSANTDQSAPKSGYDSDKSGRSSLADRRREFFLSSPSPSPDIVVDLDRPISPKKELNVAVTEITLLRSSATSTLQSSRTTLRSVSPLARSHSPLSQTDPLAPRARSASPSPHSKDEKEKPLRGNASQEPVVISVSRRPVEQSPPKRPVPAPRKGVPLLNVPAVENQPPGTRMSVSSVSTIDSTGLSQPFEEMGREYGALVGEHYPHISERDLSRHTSSMESLVQTVTEVPKTLRKETLSPRPPTPPSQPPPETDTEKSGDESQKKKTGGIWALLGPKTEPPKVSTANKTAPIPSPDPTLSSDSESERFEIPDSTDESFQTPRSTTPPLSPPPQMEPELTQQVEEPVQATMVTAPELPPDLFQMPLENLDTIPYMDSDAESSNVTGSKTGSELVPSEQGHDDIPFMDSSDESETEDLKRRREPVTDHQELLRGPNASAPLAYDENGYL